jgi:hypothetical protein
LTLGRLRSSVTPVRFLVAPNPKPKYFFSASTVRTLMLVFL